MILYKYLPPTRKDVILNRRIRFTQYWDFNDPFELKPNVKKIGDNEQLDESFKKNFLTLINEKEYKNPTTGKPLSKEFLIQLEPLLKKYFDSVLPVVTPQIIYNFENIIPEKINSTIGALSLSEQNDNELMWSHYSDNHKGYAIGFDVENQFFNKKKSDIDELRCVRKMVYTSSRPEINLMSTSGTELFFMKSNNWEYEREWRMLLPLQDANEVVEAKPFPICLFKFPSKAVKKIIFGTKIDPEIKKEIKAVLFNDNDFEEVELYQARLGNSSYDVLIEREN